MAIHIKKTLFATQRYSAEVRQEREQWLGWMKSLDQKFLYRLVFLDESCAKTNMVPLYGWSLRGKRCFGSAPCGWQRFTMLSSLRLNGSTENILFEKGLTKETFEEFINEVLLPMLDPGDVVIMDNCRAHNINFSKLEERGITIKRLPRYSPDLNPIEMMWSQIKTKLRNKEPRDLWDLWREVSLAHMDVTAKNARGWFKGCGYFH